MTKIFILSLFLLAGAGPLSAGTAVLWIPQEHAPIDDVLSRLREKLRLGNSLSGEELEGVLV